MIPVSVAVVFVFIGWTYFIPLSFPCRRVGNTQENAEKAYLASLNKTVKRFDVKQGDAVQQMGGITVAQECACGNAIKGRGKKCPACYQRAYRERSK